MRGKSGNSSEQFSAWGYGVAVWLSALFLFGGSAEPATMSFATLIVAGGLLSLIALARLWSGFPTRIASVVFAALLLAVFLFCVQLFPLPAQVFSDLPGRQGLSQLLTDVGVASVSRPLSLAPHGTVLALLGSIPAFSCYLCAVSLRRADYPLIGMSLSMTAIVCAFFALLQRAAPADSFLHFFGFANQNMIAGTFENRNFLATQLAAAIPFLAAFAMSMRAMLNVRDWLVVLFAVIYGFVVLCGLAMSGSRAGVILAMISVALTVLYVFRNGQNAMRAQVRLAGLPLMVIGALFIIAQGSMVGILRLSTQDPLGDYRTVIYQTTSKAISAYFPFGSGFGSFVPVYKLHETAETLRPEFVNAAHNDWLQVALEGGLPAIILIAVLVLVYFAMLFRTTTLPSNVPANGYYRAAAVAIFLMSAHALVDYPLRMVSLFSFLAFCLGLMVCATATTGPLKTRKKEQRVPDAGRMPVTTNNSSPGAQTIKRERPTFTRQVAPEPVSTDKDSAPKND